MKKNIMRAKRKFPLKKLICLALIFILGFNSFAAIVSDNDGSAFITKAEFDSLKNNFQAQIDNYNNSIDAKIDGAIAAYLQGISLVKETNIALPLGWNEVTYMNGSIAPTFALPNFSLVLSFSAYSMVTSTNLKMFNYSGTYKYTKTWSSSETCLRPLCGILSGTEASKGNKYWRGIAQRYKEYYNVSYAGQAKFNDLSCLDIADTTPVKAILIDFCKLNFNGYLADLDTTSFYNPNCNYNSGSGADYVATSWDKRSVMGSAKVICDPVNGKTTDYDHIIQYKSTTGWYLSNENWANTFYPHSGNAYTASSLNSAVSKNLRSQYIAAYKGGDKYLYGSMATSVYNDGTTQLSSIGMLNATTQANAIYQFDGDKKINVEQTEYDIGNITLDKGFVLIGANENQRIKWPVHFSEVYAYNGSAYVTNANEVDIYLSYVPFGDALSSTDLISFEQGSSTVDHITTSGRIADIEWTMDKSGPVYVKCVPHFSGTSYLGNTWRIREDLSGPYGSLIFYKE